jgi:hypothetical protein
MLGKRVDLRTPRAGKSTGCGKGLLRLRMRRNYLVNEQPLD